MVTLAHLDALGRCAVQATASTGKVLENAGSGILGLHLSLFRFRWCHHHGGGVIPFVAKEIIFLKLTHYEEISTFATVLFTGLGGWATRSDVVENED